MVDNLGTRIKELRLENGLSQQTLADKLGIKQNTISKYEHNVKRPSYEVLVLLADIFETSTDYLLGRTDY